MVAVLDRSFFSSSEGVSKFRWRVFSLPYDYFLVGKARLLVFCGVFVDWFILVFRVFLFPLSLSPSSLLFPHVWWDSFPFIFLVRIW